jgi:hypothetical protein
MRYNAVLIGERTLQRSRSLRSGGAVTMAVSCGSTGVRRVALLAVICLAAAAAKNARADGGVTGLFSLRLEANKPVYHVGEDIELRLTIHNNTDQTYYIKIASPWQLCKPLVSALDETKTPS